MKPSREDVPPLWDHQREAIEWVLTPSRPGAYLHLPMGAGKTRVIVEALDEIDAKTALIVAPRSVVSTVWEREFRKYERRPWTVIRSTGLGSTQRQREARLINPWESAVAQQSPVAFAVTYEHLLTEKFQSWARGRTFDVVCFDEAHRLKAPQGKTSKAAARLRSDKRIGMSGTPMPHDKADVFGQMRAIDPQVFGSSFFLFRREFAIMGGYKAKQIVGFRNEEKFNELMARVMYSPEEGAIDLQLPEARHEIVEIELGRAGRSLYSALESEAVAEIEGAGEIAPKNGLVKLLRLMQLTSGLAVSETMPDLPVEEIIARQLRGERLGMVHETVVDDSKKRALADILDSARADPIVVFALFSHELRIAHEAALSVGLNSVELSGQRDELDRWQSGEAEVIVIQIQSGSDGIDLTRAPVCVYLSTGFNLGQYLQSLKRVHRPGQKRPVIYYHLSAKETVDGVIAKVLESREEGVETVLRAIADERKKL